jgi:hypothetical protein
VTNDKRNALIDCLGELNSALLCLDEADDSEDGEDEFIVSVHWAIKDIQSDIEKVLS